VEILDDMSVLMTLVVGGAVAISAFFWLATFSRGNVLLVGGTWLFGGVVCALLYFFLASRYSLSGPIIIFLSTLIAGLLQFLPP